MRTIYQKDLEGKAEALIKEAAQGEYSTVRMSDGTAAVLIDEPEWTILCQALALCMRHPEWTAEK